MASKKTIEKTKLIRLLKTFSLLEWKRFGRLVRSPYHNSNQRLIQLYGILKNQYPFETARGLEQAVLYKKIFGAGSLKASSLQNLCSDMYRLAEDFLIAEYLQEEKRKRKKILIDALSRKEYSLFKSESERLIKDIEEQALYQDGEDYLLLYHLNNELWHHIEKDKYQPNQEELNNAWGYLDHFHQLRKLELETENLSRMQYLNTNNSKVDKPSTNLSKVLSILQAIGELHTTQSIEKYTTIKKQVLDEFPKLNKTYQLNTLIYLINFMNRLIRQGNITVHKETFALYQIGVQNQLFIINGRMRDVEFINPCMIGYKMGKITWTDEFIETHKQYLPKKERAYLLPFVKAHKALFTQDYDKVINLLKDVHPKNNLLYLIRIRGLLTKAYFMNIINGKKEFISILEYELSSFYKLIIRNEKLGINKKNAFLNFVFTFRKLISLVRHQKIEIWELQGIEQLIEEKSPMVYRLWLKEEIDKIKKAVLTRSNGSVNH